MTKTMKRMNAKEIAEFIKQMPDNSYASIAAEEEEVVYRNGDIVDYDGVGWWSIAKLSYADGTTVVFNYYGGGYPYAYPITGENEDEDETFESAVKEFLSRCDDFGTPDGYFIVDTEIESINDTDAETQTMEESECYKKKPSKCPETASYIASLLRNEFPEINMAVEMCESALEKAKVEKKEAANFITNLLRNEFYNAVSFEKEQIDNIRISLLNSTFDKIYGDE